VLVLAGSRDGDREGVNIAVFLVIALAVSCILNLYFFYGYVTVTAELRSYQGRIDEMTQLLKSLNEKLRGAVPYMVVEDVSLRFYPSMVNRTVPRYSVVYISGVASVGNLRKIRVRPVDVVLKFKVEPSTNSSVKFDYYPKNYKIAVFSEETNYVECPFSIYPIYVSNETVSFKVVVDAYVLWNNENISSASATAYLTAEVEEAEG